MKVIKFGGSSISDSERIKNVIEIIKTLSRKDKLVVVVSAFGGVTEKLIELSTLASTGQKAYVQKLNELQEFHNNTAESLIRDDREVSTVLDSKFKDLRDILHGLYLVKEVSARLMDLTMSFGERLSSFIMSKALHAQGIHAETLDTSQLIKTDAHFGGATVNFEITNRNIKNYFETRDPIEIATGFIASTENGEVTTLGRGGSDYTAAILAAALNCSEIEIWTDVNGVMTADPKMVSQAFPIESMTYEEAMEMSHFGSKVIHPKAMQPALEQNIPIRIRNTFNPRFKGTRIWKRADTNGFMVRGISSISDIALLRVQGSGLIGVTGISARLFGALAEGKINVVLITQGSSEHSLCFAVEPKFAPLAKKRIEDEFHLEILAHQIEKVIVEENLAVIAVVGEKMRGTPGIAARIFQALGKKDINVAAIAQGSSELNVSVVVSKKDESAALNVIHDAFFLNDKSALHLFVIGPGLVGSKLLEQIRDQMAFLRKKQAIEIRVHAIANSKRMLLEPDGIPLHEWPDLLPDSPRMTDLDQFVKDMQDLKANNKVFVDCTANECVANDYERILDSGISVVTPNKKASSGSFERYKKLKQIARARKVKFLYETNVGASLPIVSTIHDLIVSGDKILKVEAILSGTLSFVFNSFDGRKSFSEIVKEAREKGYSEPDPRDDLNGMDVARKLLILARETGLELELEDIVVENILPEDCQQARSVDEFFSLLQKKDAYFEDLRNSAVKAGKALGYMATLERGRAEVSLQSIDHRHPFYSLTGNENIIAFTTKRYHESPLVIRGPGAGADLTAAGVFADVLRIAN